MIDLKDIRGRHILLLLPTTTYKTQDFMNAAGRLGLKVTVCSEKDNVLSSQNPDGYLTVDFNNLENVKEVVFGFSRKNSIHAVIGVDDKTVIPATYLAEKFKIKTNKLDAVRTTRNKHLMRDCLKKAGLPTPEYRAFSIEDNPTQIAGEVVYPCVLKPTSLAASQGVIRVDDPPGFVDAITRIKKIIEKENGPGEILVESYIPGTEVALEGILENGSLRVLAIFDKPDPLNGPFFEETIYVKPSRLDSNTQKRIISCTQEALNALGLVMGPIHAELRVNKQGPWIIEIAARSIGGRCSKVLRFTDGARLEDLILSQALGMETKTFALDPTPSGVMMIPIPKRGIFRSLSGVEVAKSVPGIEEIIINAHPGKEIIPLPEGSTYLGFIFCRGETPEIVEEHLRQAHRCLRFEIV